MTPDHARELLGGLAAGILTPEERQTLFEAALHDQVLFNEVADELEFAAFLQSPETRAQLANRIEVEAEPARKPWWALRPAWLAMSGVVAASVVLFVVISQRPGSVPPPPLVSEAPAPPPAAMDAPTAPTAPTAPKTESAPVAAKTPAKPASSADKQKLPVNEIAKTSQPELRDQRPVEQPAPARAARAFAPRSAIAGAMPVPPMPMAPPTPPPSAPPPIAAPMQRQTVGVASLSGTVHDPTGAAVKGASIDVVDKSTNNSTHTATDAEGRFFAPLHQTGPYTIIASAPGFKKEERAMVFNGNPPAPVDIPLQLGSMPSTVMVAGGAPASQSVAVLDFANGGGANQSGSQVADQLSNQLLNGGQVRVIDREKVQQALQNQAAQNQGAQNNTPSAKDAAALGRSIGADAVIVGSVKSPGVAGGGGTGFAKAKTVAPRVSVTAEVIDTKEAKPMATATALNVSLQGATSDVGNQLQAKLGKPAEGGITTVKGRSVSVRFTELSGLEIGTRCDVMRDAKRIGQLVITSVNGQEAVGVFTGEGKPRTGDRVTTALL